MGMTIHQLAQGSAEWLAYRAQHFNASDAPAMMGCSPYKTRTQLLDELSTGLATEVDPATQRRFDDGHRFEALARPMAELIIGQDLYPVTGSQGRLSASFDGLTLMEDVAFEHKSLNQRLRDAMHDGCIGAELPMDYQIQMEQQCAVSGAERVLFMASQWSDDGDLIEERHCWYTPNQELRAAILAGWDQFSADLAAHVPQTAKAEPVVAKQVAHLPVVFDMRVQGTLIACNLEQYKPAALAYIAAINTTLATDQEFADADADAKFCRESADKLELAIEQAMGQMGDINRAMNTVREISAAFDAKGLALEKLVKARKEQIRQEIVAEGAASLRAHIQALNERIGRPLMPLVPADFAAAVKGKRTVESLRDAVNTELARAKIEASAIADRITINLRLLQEREDMAFLFPDAQAIVLKATEDLQATMAARIADHEAKEAKRLEVERERIRQEEAATAARELAAAELAKAKASAEGVTLSPAAQALNEAEGAERFAAAHPTLAKRFETQPDDGARLTLGQIGTRLGFSLTADFLRALGFEPAGRQRAAVLYRECDWPRICDALVKQIQRARDTNHTEEQKEAA